MLENSRKAIQAEDFPDAIHAAQSARDACADPARALFYEADAQMLSRQFEQAAATLHTLLDANPRNEAALELLGQLQYLTDHDADAEASFQRAIAVAPQDPEPHYKLGRMYYQDARFEEAQTQLQAAIQLDRNFYKAYDNLGLCEDALGNKDAALHDYLKALELVNKDHPEYDTVYENLAEFMLRQNDNQRAFNLAVEAAKRNPHNPRNFFLAGKALDQAGHDDVSLRWLKRAAQIDPAYPDPHYLMARIYKKQGKSAEANAEMDAFKALADKAPKVRR
jgi:tetratricopeptide (TPR) repeat protein